jgi:hypothetical protein
VWCHTVESLGTVAVTGEWSIEPTLHCSRIVAVCPHARLAGIDCAACPHVLQAHDDPDVRRLGNVRACVGNMRV